MRDERATQRPCAKAKAHRHTGTQTHRHTDTQTTPLRKGKGTQAHRHTGTQTYRHTDNAPAQRQTYLSVARCSAVLLRSSCALADAPRAMSTCATSVAPLSAAKGREPWRHALRRNRMRLISLIGEGGVADASGNAARGDVAHLSAAKWRGVASLDVRVSGSDPVAHGQEPRQGGCAHIGCAHGMPWALDHPHLYLRVSRLEACLG